MADRMTPEQRHRCMVGNRARDTRPEVILRHALWRKGLRYRINDKRLPGTPDIVLPKYRTAIFVNGCYWHGHEGCSHYTVPRSNTEFWVAKVARNRERDQRVWRRLEAKGWNVLTVWECELTPKKLEKTAERVIAELGANQEEWERLAAERRRANRSYRTDRRQEKAAREALQPTVPRRIARIAEQEP